MPSTVFCVDGGVTVATLPTTVEEVLAAVLEVEVSPLLNTVAGVVALVVIISAIEATVVAVAGVVVAAALAAVAADGVVVVSSLAPALLTMSARRDEST